MARPPVDKTAAEAALRAGTPLPQIARETGLSVRTLQRLAVFDAKGPWGHRTRATLDDLVQVILDEFGYHARVEPGCVDRMVRT